MVGSVYIKDGNIYFYNETRYFGEVGGITYTLGHPLLHFVRYEQERFDEAFGLFADSLDNDYAHALVRAREYLDYVSEMARDFQRSELYVHFYVQQFFGFVYRFIESPHDAIFNLAEMLPNVRDKLDWARSFEYPAPPFCDSERRLFRAAKCVVELLSEHFRRLKAFINDELEALLALREKCEENPLEYIGALDARHEKHFYLERPFQTFYGRDSAGDVVQLYSTEGVTDLFRYEFLQMAERGVYVKKCANCGRFFIPTGRTDAEYCTFTFDNSGKRCNEVGAMLRYEKKVAENPILTIYKKAYRRNHARTRTKKLSQSDFLAWSEEASRRRDACVAGELPFDEFVAWLEDGRLRKR